ncbi:MAG: DEAD/DEAH box helicase [Candidatus Hydrogenedentales bacterium]
MNVFDLRDKLVKDYKNYTKSFIHITDERIHAKVNEALEAGALWPEPLLQLNPTFQPGGTIDQLVADKTLHPECAKIFRIGKTDRDLTGKPLQLHRHQTEAIRKAKESKSYVLTSGTGSGKSLAYIVPIVDHILRRGSGKGIQAIVVYPMNALANSQDEELRKFIVNGYGEDKAPIRFARYTGQEKGEVRESIRSNPPDILLTNYMMLELLLTRKEDRELVREAQGLRFLVFDELHTYRGRQGADVALLIRRCRLAFGDNNIICVGTSATMAAGGSSEEQKDAVAQVARTLFGTPIDASQVINETLQRATKEIDFSDQAVVKSLTDTVTSAEAPPQDPQSFCEHPLASWIETTFGIVEEEGTGTLIRQTPRQLRGEGSAAAELADLTQSSPEACYKVLHNFLLCGSELRADGSSRFPIFAFRLHQFFTRGDTVWSTLEAEDQRHLEMGKLGSKPGEEDKPLFPLVFCRRCGTAYYRVSYGRNEEGQEELRPREDSPAIYDDKWKNAYLYVSERAPWPQDTPSKVDRLPESMRETTAKGEEKVAGSFRRDLPQPVFVAPSGRIVRKGEGVPGGLILENFLFCLNPDCLVAYTKHQKAERPKLGTLGIDNRSTATTILAVQSLLQLQSDAELSKEARKLLSFTDNRQDASLQAGHFNDFAHVALLRSALFKAMNDFGPRGLSHGKLSGAVFKALNLELKDYANDSEVRGPALEETHTALKRVIEYYLYHDLKRGWRVTAPNLEDCGMLKFEYKGLSGENSLLRDSEIWEEGLSIQGEKEEKVFVEVPPILRLCPAETLEKILRVLLFVLRREHVVKVDVLDHQKQFELVNKTGGRLLEGSIWHIDDPDKLTKSVVAYPRPKNNRERFGFFISSNGAFGQYFRRTLKPYEEQMQGYGKDEVNRAIRYLFLALQRYGILEEVRSGEVPGYQINHSALLWIAGDGSKAAIDHTRLIDEGISTPKVNEYFVECYRKFVNLKCVLEAREHTAQVASEDREEREDLFRSARLPLLFCSPTMELGVDIAELNLVNLRNVPPTPANYAQRSGRAGRGGQPALVYTYCAGRSPHDQYYFRKPTHMVAGAVVPPRLDLRNRDLLRSHVHAIWMEQAKLDLGLTLGNVLDRQGVEGVLPLKVLPQLKSELINPRHRAAAQEKVDKLLDGIQDLLEGATWFHENWSKEVLDQIEKSFDNACERWRNLYRAAVHQRELHHKIIGDASRPDKERKHSSRLRAQAESQIRLLTEAEGVYEGDFYSYRYFAAEGFLPGYNFPRLPISAYVPGRYRRKGRDEFVSRPRFLAISEFGPRALIYHEGARYRVYKVNLDFGSEDAEASHGLSTMSMKRCDKCGYGHLEKELNLKEICDRCGEALDHSTHIQDLVYLQNVSLKLTERITCDEEERQRYGYKMVTAYEFPEVGGKSDRKDAEVYAKAQRLIRLNYSDATTLYRINMGWANQQSTTAPGFLLNLERGYWASNPTDTDDPNDKAAGSQKRVVPYVTDTKNALIMAFDTLSDPVAMASLQSAFKEAIQKHFQIEPRELSCEAMPSLNNRKEILFYEASEGGAGILRQLVEDPKVIPLLARCALEICHFDPDTLEDQGADTCGKACYNCLLDYANQSDHQLLDRFRIRDFLKGLMAAECKPAGGRGSREERMIALRKRCDSELEKKWLDQIDQFMLRPPGAAQHLIESCSTLPDFFYHEYNAAIYIDGPIHDRPEEIRKDDEITNRLIAAGYIVIRFHHKEDWPEIFQRHPDIFGELQV